MTNVIQTIPFFVEWVTGSQFGLVHAIELTNKLNDPVASASTLTAQKESECSKVVYILVYKKAMADLELSLLSERKVALHLYPPW